MSGRRTGQWSPEVRGGAGSGYQEQHDEVWGVTGVSFILIIVDARIRMRAELKTAPEKFAIR